MITTRLPSLPEVSFTKARIKLTIWYLFIVMSVSLLFSLAIFTGINSELDHFQSMSVVRREVDFFGTRIQRTPAFAPETITRSRQKLVATLFLINLGILFTAGVSGFILAGKTLKPIETMVEEQKRFVADASHELRTPLTAMKTEIEVALLDKKMTLPQAKNLLKSNLEETNRLESLSNYLLSLSRYQSGQSQFIREKFSLTELLNEVVEKLNPQITTKKIIVSMEKKEVEAYGDRSSLRELFTILIDNAVKYSFAGGEVIVKASNKNNHTIVSIADHGMGINAADLPHIFDRFYRAETSRNKTKIEGYGLGLSIAKSIVELHKGKIDVKSAPNAGSVFTVTI